MKLLAFHIILCMPIIMCASSIVTFRESDSSSGNSDELTLDLQDEEPPPNQKIILATYPARERIVTDIIFMEVGVHLDFSYNQTSNDSSNDDVISSPGCPKSYYGRRWVYFGSPPMCYLAGFQGPCPLGKRLFSVKNSNYGVCNCDCFSTMEASSPPNKISDNEIPSQNTNIEFSKPFARMIKNAGDLLSSNNPLMAVFKKQCNSSSSSSTETPSKNNKTRRGAIVVNSDILLSPSPSTSRYQFCFSPFFQRQVMYDSLRRECYPFLEQGPCPSEDEWIVKNIERNTVECERRKCPPFSGYPHKDVGGGFTYFDYKRQECLTEVYGSLGVSSHTQLGGLLNSRTRFCREAGMKYSQKLKTCIKDISSKFDFSVIG